MTDVPKPNKLAAALLARQQQGSGIAAATATATPTAPAKPVPTQSNAIAERMAEDQIDRASRNLFVAQIEVGKQARVSFERIEQLAANIKANGQLQPIVVQQIGPHRYRLKAGERRLRAIRDVLKQDTILARVAESSDDATKWRLVQLSENLQREDYKPFELAREFAALKTDNSWTNKQLADVLELHESWVYKKLSLLEAPHAVQDAIEAGQIAETDFYNNKQLYLDNPEAVAAAAAATAEGEGGLDNNGSAAPKTPRDPKDKAARAAMVGIPMRTAIDLVELLQALAAENKLNEIELSKKPTKKELVAVLTARAREIKRTVKSN